MSANKYTIDHVNDGVPSQVLLDAGLNVFGLQLFLESYTNGETPPSPLKFRYLGVDVSLHPDEKKG